MLYRVELRIDTEGLSSDDAIKTVEAELSRAQVELEWTVTAVFDEHFPPGPSVANEHLYMRLGAVVSDKITVWAEEPFGKGE